MPSISATFAKSAPFKRPTGPLTFQTLGDSRVVVSVPATSVTDKGESDGGMAFTPREDAHREGDRFTYNGIEFSLVGFTRGDHPHPVTGNDFGWVVHSLRREAPFGNQTLTLNVITDGPPDRNNEPEPIETAVTIEGCRFQPVRFTEKQGLADIATELWEAECPPSTELLAAKAADSITFGTRTFQVVGGIQPIYDAAGSVHKITVLCQLQT